MPVTISPEDYAEIVKLITLNIIAKGGAATVAAEPLPTRFGVVAYLLGGVLAIDGAEAVISDR